MSQRPDYDVAGRITQVGGVLNNVTTDYATNLTYENSGALRSLTLAGTGLSEQHCYNTRLQPTGIRVGGSVNADCGNLSLNDRLNLAYTYGGTSNNGNVGSQTIQYRGSGEADFSQTQRYSYDSLNRLETFTENGKQQTYGFDRYGNRWLGATHADFYSGNAVASNVPTNASHVSTATNRLTLPGRVDYDSSGRGMMTKSGAFDLSYDGEDRVRFKLQGSVGSASYEYDGSARRVRKLVCARLRKLNSP